MNRFLRSKLPQRLFPFLLLAMTACSSGRIQAPKIEATKAGQQAIAQYDTDKDGFLDAAELERCPALKGCLKAVDKDGDGRLSAAEIADRIVFYQTTRVGLMSVVFKVTLNGQPLEGATVTFIPERFLGSDVKQASGVTNKEGVLILQTAGQPVPGVQCGLFRIEISKKNAAGEETLPARYNVETMLGREIAPDTLSEFGATPFELTKP